MSFLRKLARIRRTSTKAMHWGDLLMDVVEDIAVATSGVPVSRKDDGELVAELAQDDAIAALEKRVKALESKGKKRK